jgi:hypothetical protein
MPLSPPAARERMHTRAIQIDGYLRADGDWDIEAHLTDVKTYTQTNHDRGLIEPGDPIHEMWLRLTVNDAFQIVAVEAATDKSPYQACPGAAPNFQHLVGLHIRPGFLRDANHLVGGTVGCTHLRELLQQMATTTFQTINSAKTRREMTADGSLNMTPHSDQFDRRITEKWEGGKKILNTCIAYDEKGPLVKRRWPHLYTGGEAAAE